MDYRSMAKKAGYVTGGFLGALALFLPSTPKHKSIDAEVMKNLKPGNAQTQQVAHSQPTLDEYIGASPGHTAEEAYAGGTKEKLEAKARCERKTGKDDCYFVDDYYSLLPAVENPDYPSELHVDPNGPKGFPNKTKFLATEGKCPVFKDGRFTDYFFNPEYHEALLNIFENDGYDRRKIENFFEDHRNEETFRLFPKDGYAHLKHLDKEADYIMPLSQKAINKILEL